MIKVVSFDLWNTLIRIQRKNAFFLTKTLLERSSLSEREIINITSFTGRYFDDLAISSGHEVSSQYKLAVLLRNVKADYTVDELELILHNDLLKNPPILIDGFGLRKIDTFLLQNDLRFIISSNSGFMSSKIMNKILDLIGITSLSSFGGAYFSDQLGVAKPSPEFFYLIQKKSNTEIIIHCGDNPRADCHIQLPFKQILFSNTVLESCLSISRITEIIELL